MEENNNIVEENEEIIEETTESIDNNEDTSEDIEKEIVEEETVEKELEEDEESEEDNTNDESKESTEKENQSEEDDKEVETKSSKIIFIIVITVIVLLLLGLVGVLVYFNTHNEIKDDTAPKKETKEVVEVTSKNEVSNEWKEYVISVYNKTIKLPTAYERVEALSGFKLDPNLNSYMKANSNDIINMFVEDKLALYVYVKNDKDEEIEYKDSKVIGIWQSKYQVETNHAEKIIFPGNLVVGQDMNKDTLVSLFGEPSNVRNTNLENYISEDYYYYEDEKSVTEKFYRITVVNGRISDLYLVTEK